MNCRRLILTLLVLLTAMVAMAGPDQKNALQHIKFGKARIVSFVPTGLRSARASVELEAKNDTSAFTLQDVRLLVYRKGLPFVEGVCDEVTVPKGTSKVQLTGEFDLCDDVSVWSALTALKNPDLSEFTGDIDMTIVSGKGRKIAWSQQGLSLGGKPSVKKADTQVASADGKDAPSAKPAAPSPARKADGSKPSSKPKKRPWWQFWKR